MPGFPARRARRTDFSFVPVCGVSCPTSCPAPSSLSSRTRCTRTWTTAATGPSTWRGSAVATEDWNLFLDGDPAAGMEQPPEEYMVGDVRVELVDSMGTELSVGKAARGSTDRKRGGGGKSGQVRGELEGRRIIKKK